MNQLLISVKSMEEALIASYANVDFIDLKDPSLGALGALRTETVSQIVKNLNGSAMISATVGEEHKNVASLINDIKLYANLGVDVVKIAVSDLFFNDCFFEEISKLTAKKIKLVAVFFADEIFGLELLQILARNGFYGAMLDTKLKKAPLLDLLTLAEIRKFLSTCEQWGLVAGLAGSLSQKHLNHLLELHPDFIGMRGGVCQEKDRASKLLSNKVIEAKEVLLNYNKIQLKREKAKKSFCKVNEDCV